MFFYLGPKRAEISDASSPLIDTYRTVRKNPDEILQFLRPLRPSRTRFHALRKYNPRGDIGRAGQFIFLNKACWNGLYRVNSDGIFNVPYGWPRTNFIINEENLRRCSVQLRRREISIRKQDFEEIENRVSSGDFVFFDPPYVTSHNMNGFIDWNEALFSWKDQIRLAKMAQRLIRRQVNVLVTNADHRDVKELYSGFGHRKLVRYSTLAADASRRVETSEAIFFGGPAYKNGVKPGHERGHENGSFGRFA